MGTFYCSFCSLDTYMSHEGVIYCKPHHRELFQPKVVVSDILNDKKKKNTRTEEAVGKHLYSPYYCSQISHIKIGRKQ